VSKVKEFIEIEKQQRVQLTELAGVPRDSASWNDLNISFIYLFNFFERERESLDI
jgi:hypothetical protein